LGTQLFRVIPALVHFRKEGYLDTQDEKVLREEWNSGEYHGVHETKELVNKE